MGQGFEGAGQWPSSAPHRAERKGSQAACGQRGAAASANAKARTTASDVASFRLQQEQMAFPVARLSANPEADINRHEDIDRRGPKTSRLEPPLGNGRDCFLIEAAGVERSDDTNP